MFRVRQAYLGAAALALGLLLAPATARAVDPKLLPNDAEWVFSVNLKQMLESELVKANKENLDQLLEMAKQALRGDGGAEKFFKAAGFDPMKDMSSFSVAGPAGTDPDKLVIIVEGKFNVEKVHAAAEEASKGAGDSIRTSKIGTVKVYEVSVPGEKTVFASLIDNKTLVATASKEGLADAIARSTGTKKSTPKKEFRDLLETTNPRQSVSFVATGNALSSGIKNAPNIPNPDQVAAALGQIDGLSGSLTLGKEMQFELNVAAKDAETAKKMADGANLVIGAVKAMVQKKAEGDPKAQIASDILKTLRITNRGSNLVFRGEMSLDVIERIFKALPM